MLFHARMICLSGLNLILPIEVFIKALNAPPPKKNSKKTASDLTWLNCEMQNYFCNIQVMFLIYIRCNHCFNRGRESDPEIPDDPGYKTSLTTPPVHRKSIFWEGTDKKWAMSFCQCPCIISEFGVSAFSNHNNCRNYLAQMLPHHHRTASKFSLKQQRNNRDVFTKVYSKGD